MKKHLCLLIALFGAITAFSQQPAKDSIFTRPGNGYSADSFRLTTAGRRISFYSFCYGYGTGRTVYFRKDQDSAIHRVTYHNLGVALADNPASMQQLHIAGTNIGLGIGLVSAGLALTTVGLITTIEHNHNLSNAYNQATAGWFAQAQAHPFSNAPMPAIPHYSGPNALFYLGTVATLSCIIPFCNVARHERKAIDIYNGID